MKKFLRYCRTCDRFFRNTRCVRPHMTKGHNVVWVRVVEEPKPYRECNGVVVND